MPCYKTAALAILVLQHHDERFHIHECIRCKSLSYKFMINVTERFQVSHCILHLLTQAISGNRRYVNKNVLTNSCDFYFNVGLPRYKKDRMLAHTGSEREYRADNAFLLVTNQLKNK